MGGGRRADRGAVVPLAAKALSAFETFAALHVPGDPLTLFNVWDAGSAQAAERAGAKAVSTSSWAVAAAHGFPDGEALPLDLALASAGRIAAAVSLPVSIDFESGYAVEPEALGANMARLAASGAVGCNFEDGVVGAFPECVHPLALQAARIAAARRALGPDFFINARTDIFSQVRSDWHDEAMVEAAIARAHAYAEAGANGFFVPDLVSLRMFERVCRESPLPVNFLAYRGAPSVGDATAAGAARISFGPGPFNIARKAFEAAAWAAHA